MTDKNREAQSARDYIKIFSTLTMPGTEYVDFPSGRIFLSAMTDKEAIKVARGLQQMEAEAARKRGTRDN